MVIIIPIKVLRCSELICREKTCTATSSLPDQSCAASSALRSLFPQSPTSLLLIRTYVNWMLSWFMLTRLQLKWDLRGKRKHESLLRNPPTSTSDDA